MWWVRGFFVTLSPIYKKSVRVSSVAHPAHRGSGIALIVRNEQRRSPRLYEYTLLYIIPMDAIVALLFDYKFWNCQIPMSQEQSVK